MEKDKSTENVTEQVEETVEAVEEKVKAAGESVSKQVGTFYRKTIDWLRTAADRIRSVVLDFGEIIVTAMVLI